MQNLKNRLQKFIVKSFTKKITFEVLASHKSVYLYAGDLPNDSRYSKYIGLSITRQNAKHILHDVTNLIPLPDESVDGFQSEDVFEHIPSEKLTSVINEIYRVLKPGCNFRLSVPDYRCNVLYDRSKKDENGAIIFDPGGGGDYINGAVINGGHLWFPNYEKVKKILSQSKFTDIKYLHYYDEAGNGITNTIDYSLGFVMRTPDNDERCQSPYRPMSIVCDCRK